MATYYMSMTLPVVTSTSGPDYANEVNDDLDIIDEHNHTTGKGTPVPTSGLNINASLPFNGNDAYDLRTARFRTQTSTPSGAADVQIAFSKGGELHYRDASGNDVAITNGGSVAGTTGSIGGLTSPAAASYGTGEFTWQSNTGGPNAAGMDCGPVTIRDTTSAAFGITLKSPSSIPADYNITLPASAPPSGSAFLRMNSSGVTDDSIEVDASTLEVSSTLHVKAQGVGTTQLADLGVTRAKQAAVGQVFGSDVETASTTNTSFTTLTGLAVTLTTTGRPVVIMAVPASAPESPAEFYTSLTGGSTGAFVATAHLALYITGSATTSIGPIGIGGKGYTNGATTPNAYFSHPPSSVMFLYPAAEGTYTFQMKAKIDTITSGILTVGAQQMRLVAWEL